MQSSERSMRSSRKLIPDQMPSPSPENQSDTGQYMCIECGETFDTRLELNSHRQSHVTKKQFSCTRCGRGFHHQVFLQMHERSHEDGGSGVKTPPVRVISTRSTKMADVVHVRPTYTKPQRLLNSMVKFKNEQTVCQTFTPKECVTRLSHGAASPVTQTRDSLEKQNLFELRISKLSDTTVHLMDSFGNSIEILADVFNTYTIAEPEENGVDSEAPTKTAENSPSRNSDEMSSKSFTEMPSVSPSEPSPPASEMDSNLPPSQESVTGESIASQKLDPSDAGPSVPTTSNLISAAAPGQEPEESQPSSETIVPVSDKESLQLSSVSQETVNHPQAVDSGNLPIDAEDHMDTSPEDATGPTFPQELQNEPSSTLITSTADETIGSADPQDTRLEENSSTIALPVELASKSEDRSLLDVPGPSNDAACSIPKTNKDDKQPEEIADAEQNKDLTLLKPEAEIGQALIPPVDSPPERPAISSALPDNVPAYNLPPESSAHEQSSKDVNPSHALSITKDSVSLTTESPSIGIRSAEEPGTPNKERTHISPASEEHSERIGVGMVIPEKRDLQSASVEENAAKNLNLESDICMTSRGEGEVSISEGEVCSPARNLQVDNKEPEKPCSLLSGQDMLHDEELAIDDKRDDDLFERDIFPLEAPMEVCEKSLASIEEQQNIVCGGEAHSRKMMREKESDICLNGSDMTYISESEMIKLLEQDKDDIADDEPMASSQKDLEKAGLSHKDGTFSEPKLKAELSNNTKEIESCRSSLKWEGEQKIAEDFLTSKHSDNTAEVKNYQIKPTFQATMKEKMDTDSCLPLSFLTNDEPRTGDTEPQDPTKSMLTQDSVSKHSPNGQLGFTETSSSSNFQPLRNESNPDLPQAEQGLPSGDQKNYSSSGIKDVSPVEASALPRTEDTTEEDNDVFVTVEDECDDKGQQIEPLESPSIKDAVIESGHGKPHTSTPGYKGLFPATAGRIEPKQTKTIECVGDNLPEPLPGHDRETQKTVCNQEGNPPLDDLNYMQSTSDDDGDRTSERTDVKDEGMQVELDPIFLLKKKEKNLENNDAKADICTPEQTTDLSSDLGSSSKTLSTAESAETKRNDLGKLPTAKTDLVGLEGKSVLKDMEMKDVEKSSVAASKAINEVSEVMEDDDQPLCPLSVHDSLDDSELIENEHQDEADNAETPSKPLGVGGECLKCGRKLRRGRKEMVWLPVCFKCRKAAKKLERLSNQEIADGVSVEPVKSRRQGSLSALSDTRTKRDEDGLQNDISGRSATILDPLLAPDGKAALSSAAKKRYKCPKCDEAFRIPALLAGHIKCHTLPQCLTCGCQMRLKYKTKRIPRRCQKCVQQLKEKRAAKKVGEGSGDEYSGTSDYEDAVSLADITPDDDDDDDDDVSDEDSHVAVQKAKRKPLKAAKPCDPNRQIHDDVLLLSESPTETSSFKKDKGMSKTQELDSSDELDASDQNIGLLDGEKPRLCPQCGKAFPCNRSLNLHLLSHSGVQCESCGCRLPKRRRVGRWSRKCRGCRLQVKDKLSNDSGDEMGPSSDKLPKQKNVASLRLKAKPSKNTKIQSIIKKKKELKWMNMLLAVKGLMDKSRKKKENALKAAGLAKKEGESSEAEKCDASTLENASIQPDQSTSDPHHSGIEKAGPSELPGEDPSDTPKPGRKCLYKEKNIIKVEENEVLPYLPTAYGSNATPFIKQEETWQCLECNQSWPNCEALVNHQHSHTSGQSLTCPQCPQVFSGEQYLDVHVHAHDEERPFRCPECDKTFTKRNHLGVHMRVHSGSRPFVCPDCPCRFRQKVTLIAHRYSHRNYQLLFPKPFQCSVCSKIFKQKERLVVHERLHTGECPFSCKDCDKVFPSKARLYVHRKMHKICEASSSGEQNLTSNEVLEGQPFKCQDCGKICSTKASFVLHRKVHRLSSIPVQSIKREQNEEEPAFTCKDCNKAFSSKGNLSMHLKNHSAHKASAKSEMSSDLKECFPCKVCGKVCSTKASLALHRKVHNTPSAGEQNLLIKVESDSPSYICKDCNKVCSTKASLVLHRKVHKTEMGTETPTFKCKDCEVVCSTKAAFVLHRKVHRSSSGNRQSPKANAEPQSYNCKHCDMVCSTKASFVLHSKVHKSLSIGEQDLKVDPEPQPYNCKHCSMVCSTKASFVLHSKVHRALVGEQSPKALGKPQLYNCKYCDMVCSTKASFVLHSKVHRSLFGDDQSPKTPEEPRSYNCKHCDMVCSTKASFVLHNKVHRLSSVIAQSPKAAEDLKSYSCKQCDMVCSTKASFVLHSKVHKSGQNLQGDAGEKSFTCKVCNKVCSTKASLILHRKVHKSSSSEHNPKGDGEEPSFQCKECGKIFSSKGRLSAHGKVHEDSSGRDQNSDNESNAEQPKKTSDEKPFSCTICGLRFVKLKMLVRHKAVHGERTVTPCIHCGKQFLYMKSLFNHIKICQSKSKGKKRLKKAAAKRKVPKDGGNTSAEGESTPKKRKTDEKQKALTAAQKLKNKTVKAKKTILSKEKGKGKSGPKTKEKRANADGETASEGEGKKTIIEKPNDGKQEKPSEQTAKEPTPKKSATKVKKVKKEPAKAKLPKIGGAKKWRVLAASTVKKKNLKAVLIGGKKKLLLKKKVQLKPRAGGKAGKD